MTAVHPLTAHRGGPRLWDGCGDSMTNISTAFKGTSRLHRISKNKRVCFVPLSPPKGPHVMLAVVLWNVWR